MRAEDRAILALEHKRKLTTRDILRDYRFVVCEQRDPNKPPVPIAGVWEWFKRVGERETGR